MDCSEKMCSSDFFAPSAFLRGETKSYSLPPAADVPSAPEIQQVEPFSSTAMVEFEEPDSTGGVPVLKYKVEWRFPGEEWARKEYSKEDGELYRNIFYLGFTFSGHSPLCGHLTSNPQIFRHLHFHLLCMSRESIDEGCSSAVCVNYGFVTTAVTGRCELKMDKPVQGGSPHEI